MHRTPNKTQKLQDNLIQEERRKKQGKTEKTTSSKKSSALLKDEPRVPPVPPASLRRTRLPVLGGDPLRTVEGGVVALRTRLLRGVGYQRHPKANIKEGEREKGRRSKRKAKEGHLNRGFNQNGKEGKEG